MDGQDERMRLVFDGMAMSGLEWLSARKAAVTYPLVITIHLVGTEPQDRN